MFQSKNTVYLFYLDFHFSNFCSFQCLAFTLLSKLFYSSLKTVFATAATTITSGLWVNSDTDPGRPGGHITEPFPWAKGGVGGGVVAGAKCCSKNLPNSFEAGGLSYVNGKK